MKRSLCLLTLLCASPSFANSGLKYFYGSLTSDFEYYTGSRTKDAKVNVHEFSLADSSGAFSAALETTGNRMAAEAGAVNAERMKVEKGESIGGPKILTYSYEQAAARDGDAKVYSLRLGSTKNAFSFETLDTDRKKDKMVTFAEIAMLAAVFGDMITTNDLFALRYDIIFGGRWGGIRVNDLQAPTNEDRYKNVGYLYLPLSARLGFYFPYGIQLKLEYGQDPITLVRNVADREKPKIPLDTYTGLALEYRYDIYGLGLQYEAYRGSAVRSDRYTVDNPVYQHEMFGAYVVIGM